MGLQSLLVLALVEASCPDVGEIWEQPDQNIDTTLRHESWVLRALLVHHKVTYSSILIGFLLRNRLFLLVR